MKRLLTALAALMLFCSLAQADALPLGGPAPYPPVASAFGEDGMSYSEFLGISEDDLGRGCTGNDVLDLQHRLNDLASGIP